MTTPTSGVLGRVADAVAETRAAAAGAAASRPSAAERLADAARATIGAKRPSSPGRLADAAARALASAAAPLLASAARALASMIRGRSAVPGYAAAGARSAPSGPLAFLKDPTLSVQDKLMRLLAHLSEKWEKEMQSKLDQMGADAGAQKTSSKKSGGLLGGVAGAFTKALGVGGIGGAVAGALKLPGVRAALQKLGGPVLGAAASALGFPAAAPALVKYGGAILGAAADAASAVGDAGTAEAGGKGMSDAKRQQLTLEIQRLYEKQKEMFGLVSSILRVSHETRSAVIGNIR